jgi:hypothetical protein
MIVRTHRGQLLLVRQTDHQTLSGGLADAWGNGRFARPEPFAPLVLAAAEHDNGWRDWEDAPKVDPATRLPYQFTDVPTEEHLAFYRRGIDGVAVRDAHAGLLVNLHCQGFHNQRFGTMPEMGMKPPPAGTESAVRTALAALQTQERVLAEQVPLDLPTLWAQYKLLQVYDRLSLYLCMPPLKPTTLKAVPAGPDGAAVELTLNPDGEGVVAVSPYPFAGVPLRVEVPGRLIPHRPYENDEDLRMELAQAEAMTLGYELRAG